MSGSAGNKALVQRFLDALRSGDVAGAAACFDADRYYSHAWGGDLATTWERMKARRRSGALTWIDGDTVALVADGDRVVYHSFGRSTHTGPLFGVPACGREVTFHSLEIWRVEDGKIVEHWGGLQEAERFYAQLTGEEP
jgi:predicted SnoaL-like aldol condensation-catalyzing enzyme